MAHRCPLWTLMQLLALETRTCATLLLSVALLAACSSSPATGGDGVPLPPSADLSSPGGSGGSAVDGTEGGAATPLPAPTRTDTPSASDTAATDAPSGPPRWFPPVGSTVRLAGISPRDMLPMLETRHVRAGDGDDRHELDVEVTAVGGAEEDVARETYLVRISDDEIRVALAPDPVRRVPGPTRGLPREPVVGMAWHTPAGDCRVEAIQQDVVTFEETRTGCVRIRVTSPTGRTTFRWFDPQLGEVRREILDLEHKVLAAWALCGAEVPSVDRCREVLLSDD